jgi:hypothetical protein
MKRSEMRNTWKYLTGWGYLPVEMGYKEFKRRVRDSGFVIRMLYDYTKEFTPWVDHIDFFDFEDRARRQMVKDFRGDLEGLKAVLSETG